MSRPTQVPPTAHDACLYGSVTLYGPTFQTVPVHVMNSCWRPYNPRSAVTPQVWALPLSIATTQGIDNFFLFLRVLRCFSSPRSPRTHAVAGLQPAGLPHSDIPGSKPVCGSPGLFAAYHVLLRLLKPRHPPFALISFLSRESDISLCRFFAFYEIAVPNKYGNEQTRFFFHYRLLFLFFILYLVIFLNIVNELDSCSRRRRPYMSKRPEIQENNYRVNTRRREHRRQTRSKKEVFQPHLPVRLPCYDLAPVTSFALGRSSRSRTSGAPGSHGLTGGVYKARERIHRAMADARLLANPASRSRVADSDPN